MSSKAKTGTIKNADKPALVPKLRFPEFLGQLWRDVRLQDVTTECTTRNGEDVLAKAVMGVTKAEGIIPMQERLIGADISRYKLVRRNWFAYNPMRLNIGSIARWPNDSDILVSPDYVVFRCSDEPASAIDPEYLDHLRRSDQWEDFVTASGMGSVRVRIYYSDIGRLQLKLPPPAEQKKIAECLSSVDELIDAQARKLDALRSHKKGLMQQLVPREGETQPRYRFPEFQDAGEWEETCLGDIVGFESGGTPSKQNPKFWNGSLPWVSAKDMKQLFLEDTEDRITTSAVDDGAKQVPAGTVLMLTRGMTLFRDLPICVLRRPMSFNQDVKALRANGDLLTEFLPYLLLANKQRMLGMVDAAGHGTGRLNTDELKSFNVSYPQEPEQRRIAECLSSLEFLIPSQTQMLNALKIHKKGLMQQLFPSPDVATG